MKKLPVIIVCLCLVATASAQRTRQTFFKFAPASMAAGKITVGGEYNFKPKTSLEILIGFRSPTTKKFEYDGQKSDLESSAFSFFAGYRKYLGKKPASGFYMEPYFKYLTHKAEGFLDGDLGGETARFETLTDYKAYGIGLQLGTQFVIAKRISIDLFFLGPEANSASFSGIAKDVASSIPWSVVQADEAENDIRSVIEDLPIVGKKTEIIVDQNEKTVQANYKGFLPGLRVGASIGLRL